MKVQYLLRIGFTNFFRNIRTKLRKKMTVSLNIKWGTPFKRNVFCCSKTCFRMFGGEHTREGPWDT